MTFGSYLQKLRKEQGLRQSDLAETLGVSTVYICDIEKDRRNPPDYTKLQLIEHKLQLSPEKIDKFYDLAGQAKNGIAPDILDYLNSNPDARKAIRQAMAHPNKYDWTSFVR